MRWDEGVRRRDTTAASWEKAVAKAANLVDRFGRGTPTELGPGDGGKSGRPLPGPGPPPRAVERRSDRHRDKQIRHANLYVIPVIGTIPWRPADSG